MTTSENPESADSLRSNGRARRHELAAWLRVTLTHGVGPATTLTLLRAFGTPDRLLGNSHAAVAAVVGDAFATRLLRPDPEVDEDIRAALTWSEAPDHHLLTLADPLYPARLLDMVDPPPLLFVHGRPDCLSAPMVAIVGSREATLGGLENARAFAGALASCGLVILSGLARGIDAAAHLGALGSARREISGPSGPAVSGNRSESGGSLPSASSQALTVAVLGTGIDRIYPAANHALARDIPLAGALISELPLGTRPARSNFPRRNRLIAGLALGVLVVEANHRSGSLITARLANDLGREVFAIPGSIHSPQSRGCHQLIRDGARLVETADDILSELRLPRRTDRRHVIHTDTPAVGNALQNDVERLRRVMGHEAVSVDSLSAELSSDRAFIELQLLQLELDGIVERLPDGRVRQLPSPQ